MAGGWRTGVLALGVMAALSLLPAMAQETRHPEGSADARALIERQFDALARDDAPGAYAEAAPNIAAIFPDAGAFLAMVRQRYAPVYRHRSVEFGAAAIGADTIEQVVTLVDPDNQVWKALYRLSRQPDGTLLISACTLIRSDDESI